MGSQRLLGIMRFANGVRVKPDAVPGAPRSFFLMPGATIPALTFELTNRRGIRRRVSIDPVSGAPAITDPLATSQ